MISAKINLAIMEEELLYQCMGRLSRRIKAETRNNPNNIRLH
jgi:hypothetical protein